MTATILEFPWERTAEGRAAKAARNWFSYTDFTDPDYDFAVLDWSMAGYQIEDGSIDFDLEDREMAEATVEYLSSANNRYDHRVIDLLSDIEHLALAALSKSEDHDLEWLEYQLEQIRATMAIGVIPLGGDDDE